MRKSIFITETSPKFYVPFNRAKKYIRKIQKRHLDRPVQDELDQSLTFLQNVFM